MKISLKVSKLSSLEADTLNFYFWEDEIEKGIRELPSEIQSEVRFAVKKEDFKAKKEQSLILSAKGLVSAYKILVLGLGNKNEFDIAVLIDSIAKSVRMVKELAAVKSGIVVSADLLNKLGVTPVIEAVTTAVKLADYRFNKYKSEDERFKARPLEEVLLIIPASKLAAAEEGLIRGNIMSEATIYARDLVNEPPQLTTPAFIATEAIKIGKKSNSKIKVNVIEKQEIAKMGMNAFLGVARGSDEEPKFIILNYKPADSRKKIALLGKGITFDTGGLSLKPPASMETMKLDMAGAAAILGIFSVISELKTAVEVTGIIATCENMPSGRALKPGDILKAYNGKSIEILNTDAEGRLTLADAISYTVAKEKPDEMIDLATLTGACMIALGQDIAGLFGNNETLLKNLETASSETGELIWRMPLFKKYKELNKSKIADIKNTGTGKYAGAITAALFLEEFVGNCAWAHLDIAGPAFMEKDTPLIAYGGSGFGVRLILHFLMSI